MAHNIQSNNHPEAPGLKERLTTGEFIVAPGVHDMVTLLAADRMDFSALYMTGYGVVASQLGLPDAGLATYSDMVGRVEVMARSSVTPLIADGDTGYGGLLNVQHTVRGYENAGAAAIQLEDQEFPKRCGHTPGRRCIPIEDMVQKVRVARDTRSSDEFLIIARTDARTTYGLDDALKRAEAYGKAGADVLFVESPESVEEMAIICDRLEQPKVVNNVEGGRTPILSDTELEELGFSISIHPLAGFLGALHAYVKICEHLKATRSTTACDVPRYDFDRLTHLMGFERIWEFEHKYGGSTAEE